MSDTSRSNKSGSGFAPALGLIATIVIPTYKRDKQLSFLIKSLEAFGYAGRPDVEIIIVNNDPLANRRTSNTHQFANILHIHQPIRGRSAAINLAVQLSKGKFIISLDDDTVVIDGNWLETLLCHFERDPYLGYVGGNVVGWQPTTAAQKMWEAKGALSKGALPLRYDTAWFQSKRPVGVPVRLIAVGANCAIPRAILQEIGGYDERFGPGSEIPHGESLDICYRLLRAGYTLRYEPNACVAHLHPSDYSELRHKMFIYGIGDTAVHTKFFLEFGDLTGTYEVLWGRPGLLLYRAFLRLIGRYPMRMDLLLCSLAGALLGPCAYFKALFVGILRSRK